MTETLARVIAEVKTLTPEEREELREMLNHLRLESTPRADGDKSVLDDLLLLSTDLGISDLAAQHDHYLYGVPRQ